MVEITDEDSARAYFETQPSQVCRALLARAALRSLAVIEVKTENPDYFGKYLFPVLRALLSSVTAAHLSDRQKREIFQTAIGSIEKDFEDPNYWMDSEIYSIFEVFEFILKTPYKKQEYKFYH